LDLIPANGESVGFDRVVRKGDRISTCPVFESFDVCRLTRVGPEPLRVLQFVPDTRLGTLSRHLRPRVSTLSA